MIYIKSNEHNIINNYNDKVKMILTDLTILKRYGPFDSAIILVCMVGNIQVCQKTAHISVQMQLIMYNP